MFHEELSDTHHSGSGNCGGCPSQGLCGGRGCWLAMSSKHRVSYPITSCGVLLFVVVRCCLLPQCLTLASYLSVERVFSEWTPKLFKRWREDLATMLMDSHGTLQHRSCGPFHLLPFLLNRCYLVIDRVVSSYLRWSWCSHSKLMPQIQHD